MSQLLCSLKNTIKYINVNEANINIGYGIDDNYSRATASSCLLYTSDAADDQINV